MRENSHADLLKEQSMSGASFESSMTHRYSVPVLEYTTHCSEHG